MYHQLYMFLIDQELSKELHVVRKQVKDVHASSDGLSQSSRTSSSSSLTNGDGPHEKKLEDSSTSNDCNVCAQHLFYVNLIVALLFLICIIFIPRSQGVQ